MNKDDKAVKTLISRNNNFEFNRSILFVYYISGYCMLLFTAFLFIWVLFGAPEPLIFERGSLYFLVITSVVAVIFTVITVIGDFKEIKL